MEFRTGDSRDFTLAFSQTKVLGMNFITIMITNLAMMGGSTNEKTSGKKKLPPILLSLNKLLEIIHKN
jgi:hypothetical protein